MNLDDFPKTEKDGVICISDTCISCSGEDFETRGEFCSECECGITPDQVTMDNLENINMIRIKYSQPKLV